MNLQFSKDKQTQLLQIWILPNKQRVKTRYEKITLKSENSHNKLTQIISPNSSDAGTWIHQDAWFYIGNFDASCTTEYILKKSGNGVYIFIISGDIEVEGISLHPRDGIGIWDTEKFSIKIPSSAKILIMEVPMLT